MKQFRIKDYIITVCEELPPHDDRLGPYRPYYDRVFDLCAEGLVPIQDQYPDLQKPDFDHIASKLHPIGGLWPSYIRIGKENEWGEEEIVREVGLVLPYYVHIEKCTVPAGENLFLMMDDFLCLFDPETLEVVKQVEFDRFVTMEAAYPYRDDIILVGDGDVYRVSKNLSIRWNVKRRTLFLMDDPYEDSAFELKEDRICMTDEYYGDYYEVSYEGDVLKIEESEFTRKEKRENPEKEDIYFRIKRY